MIETQNDASLIRNAPSADPAAKLVTSQATDLDLYLDAVFGDGSGHACGATGQRPYLSEKGKYTFGKYGWTEFNYRWPEERDGLAKVVLGAAEAEADVYLCPYLRETGDRKKGGAVERRLIHADIDGAVPVKKVEALGGFAVGSGTEEHGHVYVALSAPVTVHEHEVLCRALGRHLGYADAKVSDNDLLRPPGSVNRKPTVRAGVAVPVRWLVKP